MSTAADTQARSLQALREQEARALVRALALRRAGAAAQEVREAVAACNLLRSQPLAALRSRRGARVLHA